MEETILSCTSEEADKLVDLLWKVKNGDVVITNVTKVAGNVVESKFQSYGKRARLSCYGSKI